MVVPSRTVDCWSCDAPNTPSRMFCVSCGSFIAIGSRTKAVPAALPFSGPPPVPGDADVDVSLPFVEGVAPLGSYSVEAQRLATRRTRTMTAVVSVVMAMVVGGAALYLASPLSDRGGVPQTAAVVLPSSAPTPTEASLPEDRTTAVSGLALEPEPLPAVAIDATTDLEPLAALEPLAEPQPLAAAEPEPQPVVESIAAAKPEPVVEEVAAPAEPTLRRIDDAPVVTAGGWVCDGTLTIDDSRLREWSLGRVSFRVRPGFERVVLHLERAGQGAGDPASVTAQAVASTRVRNILPGVNKPSSGKTTIGLRLDDGFAGNLALRSYRPSGLATIQEFSVYPSGRDGRNVLISTASDGCFRVRVPAWNDASNSVRRAEIHIDVKP